MAVFVMGPFPGGGGAYSIINSSGYIFDNLPSSGQAGGFIQFTSGDSFPRYPSVQTVSGINVPMGIEEGSGMWTITTFTFVMPGEDIEIVK